MPPSPGEALDTPQAPPPPPPPPQVDFNTRLTHLPMRWFTNGSRLEVVMATSCNLSHPLIGPDAPDDARIAAPFRFAGFSVKRS